MRGYGFPQGHYYFPSPNDIIQKQPRDGEQRQVIGDVTESAAIKRFSQPFWAVVLQDASCEVHVNRNDTAHYYHYNIKVLCFDTHHYSLLLFAFLTPY